MNCQCQLYGSHLQIGALRDVRKDLWVWREELLAAVIADLERRLYTSAIGADIDSSEEEDDTPELSQTLVMDEVQATQDPHSYRFPGLTCMRARHQRYWWLNAKASRPTANRPNCSYTSGAGREGIQVQVAIQSSVKSDNVQGFSITVFM